jgi:glycosyltransferase involved in cell wall biosynthesis
MSVRVVLVLPYPNPHFLGLIDALLSDTRFEASILYFGSQNKFRKHFMLGSLEGVATFRVFSPAGVRAMFRSDVAMIHGLFYWHVLVVSFILFGKRVFFTSEPSNPKSRGAVKDALKCLFVSVYKLLFKEIIVLSCGGQLLKVQLSRVGLNCRCYRFGLFPRVALNESPVLVNSDSIVDFAFVGQFIPRKNLNLILQAIKKINESDEYARKCRFFFIGDGDERSEVISLCKRYGNVEYLGIKSSEEVRTFLRTNHVLILPSFFDGWGAVVNEAVFSGNAILVTRAVYASSLYLADGKNGFYISERNVGDLVNKMKVYIDNLSLLETHRCSSLELAKHYGAGSFVNDLYVVMSGKGETTILQQV